MLIQLLLYQWRIVMSYFIEQIRLAEKAAEDIYFAKISRELIESMHKQMQVEKRFCNPGAEARADDSTAVK
jgi:hypothetical protein